MDRTETEEAPTEEGRSASLSGQFSFARVWERDNARIAEEEEGALVGDQDFWADILAKQKEAEEARVAAEKAMEGRGARRRKQMYNLAATVWIVPDFWSWRGEPLLTRAFRLRPDRARIIRARARKAKTRPKVGKAKRKLRHLLRASNGQIQTSTSWLRPWRKNRNPMARW